MSKFNGAQIAFIPIYTYNEYTVMSCLTSQIQNSLTLYKWCSHQVHVLSVQNIRHYLGDELDVLVVIVGQVVTRQVDL